MAQNIALNIILNGVPQAVNNIEELELKLKQARAELSQIAINSDAFKKLSAEIQVAESKLRTLKKSAEGKDLEGKLGDLAKLGGAVGASFGAATAAFALFGEESEDTTKSLIQAQNALVIALAAREAAEGAVVVKTIANTITTRATTLATQTANSVTKAFYTTLAANPYLAIVTALGLVVGAIVAFTNDTQEATKAQKEFNTELQKDTAQEVSKFDALRRTVENVSLSLGTRQKALKDLRAQFPNYFKDLKDEDILAGRVKVQYNELRDALIQTAQARAYQNRIQKDTEQLIDIEDKYTEAVNKRTKAQKNLQDLQNAGPLLGGGGGGISSGQVTSRGQEEVILQNRLSDATEEVNRLFKEKEKIQNRITNDADKVKNIQIQTDKYTGSIYETEKGVTKEKEKQVETNTRLIAQQNELNDYLEQFQAILSFESVSEPTIIKDQEKILTNLENILTKLKDISPDINKELFGILKLEEKDFPDPFKSIIDNTSTFVKELQKVPVTFDDVVGVFKKLKLEGDTGPFTDKQKQDITSYFNTIKQGANGLKQALQSANQDISVTDEQVAKIFQDAINRREETLKKVRSGEINSAQAELELRKSLLKVFSEQLGVNTEILKGNDKSKEKLTQQFNEQLKLNENAKEFADIITTGIVALSEFGTEVNNYGEIIQSNNDKIKKQVEDIKKLIDALTPEETAKFIETLGFDVVKTFQFIAQNFDKLGPEVATKLSQSTKFLMDDLDGLSQKQLEELKKGLEGVKTEFETKAPEIANTINESLKKIDFKIFINNVQTAIQQFQSVLNTLSQTTNLFFQSQFDQLEKRYKRVQDTIIGDTEEANQKRMDAEKSYLEEKTRLEKQSAKTALRISLAQSLANTAEAITKLSAITGGVGALIAGGAVVAFNAAQSAIIANQLANIDSYRRGGMIKSLQGGGLVTGPSHEMGGVKFQGGGIELEGNESVINRVSTINYMGLLSQINQAGGGKPIGPGFDDSRIVEAIAKQRNTPIRAYVVESDITSKQDTTRRLEKLSQI